ncbi:MAG: chemotaxis protein CheD [Clostridiales bacterium]|jgi:chemotaxis protein CheD|nr:chemotaxis protein CheD [Clostridiales bacterium]
MINNAIIVGMADLNVTKAPGILTTLGLGSCVGIAIYDPTTKIAGLAHIMLPDSTQIQNNSNIAKFADTAMVKLINDMVMLGAKKLNMKAKIAGGAQMFAFDSTNSSMRIGERNVEAVTRNLQMHKIPLIAKEVGENFGRTVELYADTGNFLIKTIGHGNRTI